MDRVDIKPFGEIPPAAARGVRHILFDVDDTVTDDGKLTDGAYSAMWALFRAGYALVPVTGRPAGWCDMMLRQWPVRAVVGENGAFALYREGTGAVKTLVHPDAAKDPGPKLEALKRAVFSAVPGARLARDQFCRVYDVAFDYAEDEPRLPDEAVEAILRVCRAQGATCKLSTIHVNAWYGAYDKLSMTRLYFEQIEGEDDLKARALFFGDSPNDEPMFSFFPLSCGVENVRDFFGRMEFRPAYVASGRGGRGFAYAANKLIEIAKGG